MRAKPLLSVLVLLFLGVTLPLLIIITQQQQKIQQQAASSAGCQGMSIAAYFPPGTWWSQMAASYPATQMVVVENGSVNGPGTSVLPALASEIAQMKQANIRVFGYVYTSDGQRSISSTEIDVDAWKTLYGVTDIMYDVALTNSANLSYYKTITDYVHQKNPGSLVELNPGGDVLWGEAIPEGYMQFADIISIYESTSSQFQNFHPLQDLPWMTKYPATKFKAYIYSTPNSSVILSLLQQIIQDHIAYFDITDSTHPWGEAATDPFWNALVPAVKSVCNGVSISITSTPTPTSITHLTATPTVSNANTNFSLVICPHGLGNCGDNANPSASGNTNPVHQQRSVTLTFFNTNNQPVTTGQGAVSYNQASQNFQGTVSIPNLSSGQYLVSVKMAEFLSKQIPGIISITNGHTISVPVVSLVTGDINNDNQLDIQDYNVLISCFGSKFTIATCLAPSTSQSPGADIDDDGTVGGADYNLFLRELSVQRGG